MRGGGNVRPDGYLPTLGCDRRYQLMQVSPRMIMSLYIRLALG